MLLILGHLAVDFNLQTGEIARGKNPNRVEGNYGAPWWAYMLGHCGSHGLAVALITGYPSLGMMECIAHFFIDWLKCERITELYVDQLLHLICKLVWVCALYLGVR